MEKFKFCTNETTEVGIVSDIESVGIGYPVANSDGGYVVANNDTAIGIVIGLSNKKNEGRLRQFATVMTAGTIDEIEAEGAFGQQYADDAKNAMINITFCDNHEIVTVSGGSDPVLDNAKSTGGIGWTESGEQTVITWDGDTEGRDVLTIIDSEHPDVVVRMYKVAEYSSKQFTENCELVAAGSQFPVSLYTYDHAEVYAADSAFAIRTDGTDFDIQYVGTVHAESSGVYFLEMGGAYVESLTYGTPDTIHKIDEKYLPASGGAMVVAFELNLSAGSVTADKTVDEVKEAMLTMPVIGVISVNGVDNPLGIGGIDIDFNPVFGTYNNNGEIMSYIITSDGDWAFGAM